MNIAFDLDEVIADLATPMNIFHNIRYNTKFTLRDYKKYGLADTWKCIPEEAKRRVFEFYHSDDFMKIKPVKGARTIVNYLSKKHSLYVLSGRPAELEIKSKHWIATYFPNKFIDVIHSNDFTYDDKPRYKKSFICRKNEIEVMIEDSIEYALDCHNHNIKTFLITKPWNQHKILPPAMTRINALSELRKYL